ncbi:MAG: Hsp20/alpha crystallin family protein [Dehalococcoidia bacterium]|nr:Hsp20/alpha crystallin family protein [Dehalococcoidia bacterium]
MNEGVLSIRAEHREDVAKNTPTYYRRERRYGATSRRIALPGVVADAPAEAELRDGVLRVEIAAPQRT